MIAASRYAKSLLDLAVETKQLEEVRKDMQLVQELANQNREFIIMLQSPVIKTDKKQAVLKSVFEGKVSKTTSAFLQLITAKRRENYLKEIAVSFDEQYKKFKNITTVIVTSAVSLDSKSKKEILELVKKGAKGEIELIEKTDTSLIGGFVLTIDDKQIDQSVRRKLNDLKKTLGGGVSFPAMN